LLSTERCDLILMTAMHSPVHIEFSLPYLLDKTGISSRNAFRRLNAFENTLSMLTQAWRPRRLLIAPVDELRMARITRDRLLSWVDSADDCDARTLRRIVEYTRPEIIDEAIPELWVRLLIALPGSSTAVSAGRG
jgi:hypothetical protein